MFESMDERLMLKQLPGVFCAGEMLDWEAPTGGYLLTACFASGRAAGLGGGGVVETPTLIVPTLCVGMQPGTLRVPTEADAERPLRRSHAERGNDPQRIKAYAYAARY